ncbi:MAG TPA: lipid-A-disaccharide synthase [Candidatus Edwardsbacteria bacterium]|nr:lipid-A-disaccharide synthase [Candidatus Edwardsbacteria bacterium]
MARIMIIAGETSGDLHGGLLVKELLALRPGTEIYGIGGDRMRDAGMELLYHIREFSFMGFVEVLGHLPFIRSVMRKLSLMLATRRPDAVVLIDYPGFNLRFARQAHRLGIPVAYYISPQVWAWGTGRVRKIRRLVDKMLVILPFEQEFYRRRNVPATYVGNPLVDTARPSLARREFCDRHGLDPQRHVIGLLPGSRAQEIERILPVMLRTCALLHGQDASLQFALGLAPHVDRARVEQLVAAGGTAVALVPELPYDVMAHSRLALVASGTATLEAGIIGTPMIIIYRTAALTYLIGRALVRVPFIGLVNFVAGKQVIPEFVQGEARPGAIFLMAQLLLPDGPPRAAVLAELAKIKRLLGEPGAARRAAQQVAELLP